MPREHASIKMEPDELRAFLASDRRLVLATLAANGDPWADCVAYVFADDRIYFRVPTGTRSLANIATEPRVCCVVEQKPTESTYYGIKGAMMHGTATPLGASDPQGIAESLAAIPDPTEPARTDGAIFSVGLDDSTSFSFAKIQYRYQDRSLVS